MAPFTALVVSFAVFRAAGFAGIEWLDGWGASLRPAVAVMFLLAASAHWGRRRPDLVAIVPPSLPSPGFVVTLTGWLEIAGAAGLLLPGPIPVIAASGLTLLLILMFPANVGAALRKQLMFGRPAMAILPRTCLQLVFAAATACAGWLQV